MRDLGTIIAGTGGSWRADWVVDMPADVCFDESVGKVVGVPDPEALMLTEPFLSRTAVLILSAVFCSVGSSSSCCSRRPRQRLALGGSGFCFGGGGGAGGAFEMSLRLGRLTPGFSLWTATSTTLPSEERAVSRFIPSALAGLVFGGDDADCEERRPVRL